MLENPDWGRAVFAAHAQLVVELYKGLRGLGPSSTGRGRQTLCRDLVYPHRKRPCDRFAEDSPLTILHSDGNVSPLKRCSQRLAEKAIPVLQ